MQNDSRDLPISLRIPDERVDLGSTLAKPCKNKEHYFQVIVSEVIDNMRELLKILQL
jgi:hypothetical protein